MYIRLRQFLGRLGWIRTATAADATHVAIDEYQRVVAECQELQEHLKQANQHVQTLQGQNQELQHSVTASSIQVRQLTAALAESRKLQEHWKACATAAENDEKRAKKDRLVNINGTYHYFVDVYLDVRTGDRQGAVDAAWREIRRHEGKPGDIIQDERGKWKVAIKLPIHESRGNGW